MAKPNQNQIPKGRFQVVSKTQLARLGCSFAGWKIEELSKPSFGSPKAFCLSIKTDPEYSGITTSGPTDHKEVFLKRFVLETHLQWLPSVEFQRASTHDATPTRGLFCRRRLCRRRPGKTTERCPLPTRAGTQPTNGCVVVAGPTHPKKQKKKKKKKKKKKWFSRRNEREMDGK